MDTNSAQKMAVQTRKAGRYAKMDKCGRCGKGAAIYPDQTGQYGDVCAKCDAAWCRGEWK